MIKKFIFSLFLLMVLNCSKTDKYSTVDASLIDVIPESPSKMETPPPPMEVAKNEVPGEVISPKKTDTISKKIIKNGDMEIAVSNSKMENIMSAPLNTPTPDDRQEKLQMKWA